MTILNRQSLIAQIIHFLRAMPTFTATIKVTVHEDISQQRLAVGLLAGGFVLFGRYLIELYSREATQDYARAFLFFIC